MPQAIAWGIASVVGSATVTTGILVAAYAVTIVGTLALSSYQKNKAERAARSQFDAAQVDRLANVPGTVVPRELVLGRIRKGGHVFYKTSVGQYKELFIMCVALAEHEIDGVEQIYLNDQPVDVNEVGQVTTAPYGQPATLSADQDVPFGWLTIALDRDPIPGSVSATESPFGQVGGHEVQCRVEGRLVTIIDPLPGWVVKVHYQYQGFNSFVNIRWHLGSPDQTADGGMTAMLPGVWTWDHRARGVAYLVCQFAYNDTALPSGIPTVTARIRGARLYDPRDGALRFSENPALMMRHVLMHPQFGKRSGITPNEDARFIAAANACDTGISYTGSDWVPMFRAAGVFQFGSAARDVLEDLSQAMGGEWAYSAGEFYVRAGVYQLPVMDLTEEDLAVEQRSQDGTVTQLPMNISPHRPRNEKINMVAIRIWDQAANYVETSIRPLRADALVAADGAELSQEVTMPAVFYAGQAWHIAGIMLRDGRDPMTAVLPFKMRAYPLEIFDGVRLTIARYGIFNKEFRIVGRTFNPNGVVQLTLKETTAAIFQYGAGFIPGGYAPNTGLPKPWDIRPPVMLSISSGEDQLIVQSDGTIINGVRVTWAPIADQSIANGGNVELQYRVLPSSLWVSILAPGDATEVKFYGVEDLAMILVRLRTRNSLAVSDWGAQVLHQVIGKTEPPPNIENLTISGSVLTWRMPRRVPDLAGFVFRFHYGNSLDWNSAAPLHNGLITESPYDLVTRPGGVVTIMGKAQDTSGNQSQVTANIVMNLGDPPIANVLEQWDFDAMGWPFVASESSGWTIIGGDPTANALDSFYGTDDQSFYSGDTEPFYSLGNYAQLIYVSPEISVNLALAGSVMTVESQTQGIDLRIEYRLTGPGSFYGPDTASFYGADSTPFYGPPGAWMPWPGQLVAANDAYQFRVTLGAGTSRGVIEGLVITIDAPDMQEVLSDVPIDAGGTVIPYAKNFTSIKAITATLQANGSGAETVRIDKSNPMAPVIRAYNGANVAVSGATADIVIQGY
jgi:Putative phage tail protein